MLIEDTKGYGIKTTILGGTLSIVYFELGDVVAIEAMFEIENDNED